MVSLGPESALQRHGWLIKYETKISITVNWRRMVERTVYMGEELQNGFVLEILQAQSQGDCWWQGQQEWVQTYCQVLK